MPTAENEMPPLKDLRPLSEFTDLLGVNKTTIFLWVKRGVKPGPIKLRAWLLGVWKTTETEVREFIERRTAAKVGTVAVTPPTPRDIKRRLKTATAALKATGFKVK